jgi:small subunit ribosomal protein S17
MKKLQGKVVSLKTKDTAIVKVDRKWAHPLYQKLVKRSKKYTCDFDNKLVDLALADLVAIEETRPLSKTKRFRVVKKIGK